MRIDGRGEDLRGQLPELRQVIARWPAGDDPEGVTLDGKAHRDRSRPALRPDEQVAQLVDRDPEIFDRVEAEAVLGGEAGDGEPGQADVLRQGGNGQTDVVVRHGWWPLRAR